MLVNFHSRNLMTEQKWRPKLWFVISSTFKFLVLSFKYVDLITIWLIWVLFFSFREGDSYDLRKKLPFCVGLLLRLLKKNHRVFITCTSGFDRSPASVIAYLHWMTDTSLHAAYNFITSLHSCKPDRFFSIPLHSLHVSMHIIIPNLLLYGTSGIPYKLEELTWLPIACIEVA